MLLYHHSTQIEIVTIGKLSSTISWLYDVLLKDFYKALHVCSTVRLTRYALPRGISRTYSTQGLRSTFHRMPLIKVQKLSRACSHKAEYHLAPAEQSFSQDCKSNWLSCPSRKHRLAEQAEGWPVKQDVHTARVAGL